MPRVSNSQFREKMKSHNIQDAVSVRKSVGEERTGKKKEMVGFQRAQILRTYADTYKTRGD
ncbi:hypothetical protein RRF57_005189 [Xylaria bambusicola]|uniref:Uncharacterized protein n=1 Tax=Xylaria bambusicola TaxID=326684 RepID=A0AAN7UPM9_9PEZI